MKEPEWITLHEAALLIAEYCYQDKGSPRQTEAKARGRIRHATKTGKIKRFPDGGSGKYKRSDFLQWAVKKCPNLGNHISIPFVAQGRLADVGLGGLTASFRHTPSDPQELKDLLNRCRDELCAAKADIKRLEPFEKKCRLEEEKKQERSRIASYHGKRGGRPPRER